MSADVPRRMRIVSLCQEMQLMFDSFTVRSAPPAWRPAADLLQDEHNVVVVVDLPGVAADEMEVNVSAGRLEISGVRRPAECYAAAYRHLGERPFGRFSRVFNLPVRVDPDRSTSELHNGVLTITMPKR